MGPTVESDQAVTVLSNYSNLPRMGFVLFSGATLVALGMLSGVALVSVAAVSNLRPSLRIWAAITGILATFIVLAAAFGVAVFLPSAWGQDLWPGRPSTPGFWAFDPNGSTTVGAGWAWYASFVAAVLFLIAELILIRAPPRSAGQGTHHIAHQQQSQG